MKPASALIMPMPICYARVIASGLGLSGPDCAALLLGSGLSPAELASDERHVSFEQQRRIILNALRISGEPGLGLRVGAMTPLSTHGALGYAAVSSADLGAALDILARYSQTRAGFFRLDLRRDGDDALLEIHDLADLGQTRRFLHEVLMLTAHAVVETVAGPKLAEATIEFSYPAPGYWRQYHAAFRVPVRFDRPVSALRLPAAALAGRCITANAASLRVAERQCAKELLALQTQTAFSAQVRAAVAAHLEHGCTVEVIARHFRLSTRTLVRRLEQEACSFRAILDETRKLSAQRLLADPERTIAEVAARLGYQDPSNLGRAFRGWFGMSPSEYRRRAGGDSGS